MKPKSKPKSKKPRNRRPRQQSASGHKPFPDPKLVAAGFIPCVPARSVLDTVMLIIALKPIEGHPFAKFVIHARSKSGQLFCFPAGMVVEQQIRETRVLPVWARLTLVHGSEHEYYKLELANTAHLCSTQDERDRWQANVRLLRAALEKHL